MIKIVITFLLDYLAGYITDYSNIIYDLINIIVLFLDFYLQ